MLESGSAHKTVNALPVGVLYTPKSKQITDIKRSFPADS